MEAGARKARCLSLSSRTWETRNRRLSPRRWRSSGSPRTASFVIWFKNRLSRPSVRIPILTIVWVSLLSDFTQTWWKNAEHSILVSKEAALRSALKLTTQSLLLGNLKVTATKPVAALKSSWRFPFNNTHEQNLMLMCLLCFSVTH